MEPDHASAQAEASSSALPLFFRGKYSRALSRFRLSLKSVFPETRLVPIDYAIAAAILAGCFFSFANPDLDYLGQNSLNFLFGNPLDFYENAKKFQPEYGGATYPPTLYAVFAVWLYPWKLLGVLTGPDSFPPYLVYWLKLATTITYLTTSYTFYLIAKEYFPEDARARYATAVWFTAPLAVFSQFIFSQTDIFHVQLMLIGYLLFMRGRLVWASLFFGLSITFKSFPAVSFFPLLFLLEKRLIRIACLVLVFATPSLLVHSIYGHSPALTANPTNQLLLERLYVASITAADYRWWMAANLRIYLVPLAYAMLCGMTYFRKPSPETRLRDSAYVWLTSSVLLFVPTMWHPQWLIFAVPAMVLTSMISDRLKFFLVLDLLGMALFVAAVSFIFDNVADASMLRGDLLKIDFHNSYLMDRLFTWFGDHSENVFYTGFSAYLLLQIVLNYRLIVSGTHLGGPGQLHYGDVRQRLYIGLALFLIPAVFAIWKDLTSGEVIVQNEWYEQGYPLVATSALEQTFIAEGHAIKAISVIINTSGRRRLDDLTVAVVDADGKVPARAVLQVLPTNELSWHSFSFGTAIAVQKGAQYSFRVLSANGAPGNAFSILASAEDYYKGGHAIVAGSPQASDLAFRIEFLR